MTTENKKPAIKSRMTRQQVKEGLEQFPIDVLIGGVGKKSKLTHKQREFAKSVAMGKPKAQAYRETYNTKQKPKAVGSDASKLASKPSIAQEIEAFKQALEWETYKTAGQMKAFVLHQLTQHAMNKDNPPQARIKSLELLGKSYDVGLFVERKEVTTISGSADIKTQLLEQLKNVIDGGMVEIVDDSAESLLAELGRVGGEASEPTEPHHTPTRLLSPSDEGQSSRNSLLTQTPIESAEVSADLPEDATQDVDFKEEKNVSYNVIRCEGEGVSNFSDENGVNSEETPPVSDSNS